MSCVKRSGSKPRPPTSSKSSVVRLSISRLCSIRWSSLRPSYVANYAFVFRREGAKYHLAANHGFAADYREWMERQSISIGRETLVGRTAFEGRTVHIPDVLADPEYAWADSIRRGGFRTMLGVPLLRK